MLCGCSHLSTLLVSSPAGFGCFCFYRLPQSEPRGFERGVPSAIGFDQCPGLVNSAAFVTEDHAAGAIPAPSGDEERIEYIRMGGGDVEFHVRSWHRFPS